MLMFILVVLLVILTVALVTMYKGNEKLKAQYRTYVSTANTVNNTNNDVVINLQNKVADLLIKRADDQVVITKKDMYIAGLVKELNVKTKEAEQARQHANQLFNR